MNDENEDLDALYVPRVVVKFADGIGLPYDETAPLILAERGITGIQDALDAFGGLELLPMFGELAADLAGIQERTLTASTRSVATPDLLSFFVVPVPDHDAAEAVAEALRALPEVETAYVEGGPTPPPHAVNPADDPRAVNQGYLGPAPAGIDARHSWTCPGGDGAGQAVVDMERGWTLNHEDLAGAGITLISGRNQAFFGHGTAVLGEMVARDNTLGGVGITPAATARVVSQHRTVTVYDTATAILSAVVTMSFGDVLLLEAQTTVAGSTFLPVEVELAVAAAIQTAVSIGITVVEAAANGSNDLDTFTDATGATVLQRGSSGFRETGAIMVGAATSTAPHSRLGFSNFGSRIDCYGWGQNIDTTGDGGTGTATNVYTSTFGGTSGASPIVAGAALAVQGMLQARFGRRYGPAHLRALLSDLATTAANPAVDRIGAMPDLKTIATELLHPWTALDRNPATTAITASTGGALFQLHADGTIWQYIGIPLVGWQLIGAAPTTRAIVAAGGTALFRLDIDGSIWHYTGIPLIGWEQLDNNPATSAIAASAGTFLYQLHTDGSIWRYTGVPFTGWEMLDNDPKTSAIAAGGGGALVQIRSDGQIWRFTGTPMSGWELMDSDATSTAIVLSAGADLYQLTSSGGIWRSTGTAGGWDLLDTDALATALASGDGGTLYRLDTDGAVWRYAGRGLGSWRLIDAFPGTVAIAAGGGVVYQLHTDGSIWQYP